MEVVIDVTACSAGVIVLAGPLVTTLVALRVIAKKRGSSLDWRDRLRAQFGETRLKGADRVADSEGQETDKGRGSAW